MKTYPCFLANQPKTTTDTLEVKDKYSGEVYATVSLASADILDEAIAAALAAERPMAKLKAYVRQGILYHCVDRFEQRFDELAELLCIEAGKPIKDARGEVTRLIDTFRLAAEETPRMMGEVIPLDVSARAKDYRGQSKRVPVGACSFISPFNFPLNLVAHKVAPAIAVGCPFVLKPASKTPLGALVIGEILAETDLPKGAFSILPLDRDAAEPLTTDPRLKLLSFTGSADVGWQLKAKAGKKKVILELGGNAACIVDASADLKDAVERNIVGAFYQSGQSCISVQRLLVHDSIYQEFRQHFVDRVKELKSGNPRDEATFIGPIISESEAKRLEAWIDEARRTGATILCGGTRHGVMLAPTVLENVSRESKIYSEEAFGPVVCLEQFKDFNDALKRVNDSRYGLQAGVFTRDLYHAYEAWDLLEVGGVIIGDVPSFRVDHMPYGGVKDSGFGREGIRFSMEDMTELRLMVIRDPQTHQ